MVDRGDASLVVVVDDDEATRIALKRGLSTQGLSVATCASGPEALRLLEAREADLVITDLVMDGMNGIALLERIRARDPDLPVVVCTGYGSIRTAVEAIRLGATDYLTKPIDLDALTVVVDRALHTTALNAENRSLRRQLVDRHDLHGISGRSTSIVAVREAIENAAATDATVLVRGESGTGKEVAARAIHRLSRRGSRPLIVVDCQAIAESPDGSVLLGQHAGDAGRGDSRDDSRPRGRLEMADGGTMLLDEVGALNMTEQAHLLRFLQERAFERPGGSEPARADARIIAITDRPLEDMVATRRFREDLFYRLNVVTIDTPPLRKRPEDVELLAHHFVRTLAHEHRRKAPVLHPSAIAALRAYRWPGNIRELRNLCENLVVRAAGTLVTASSLPPLISGKREPGSEGGLLDGTHSLAEVERHLVFQTLLAVSGNKAEAARVLGIGLKTLYRRLNDYES